MMETTETSKHKLAVMRKVVRDALSQYRAKREAALLYCQSLRMAPSRGPLYPWYTDFYRETKLLDVVEARYWWQIYRARLAAEEGKPVTPHGGRVSPAALKRMTG